MRTETVGLVGIGLVGAALAERWLSRGRGVVGFDLNPQRRDLLADRGGTPALELESIPQQCRCIVLSLPDAEVSRGVLSELLPHLPGDRLIVDTTTGDPREMQRQADKLRGCGIGYIDATIAGSSEQVRSGEAMLLVGGHDVDVADVRDLLSEVSDRIVHLGPAGSGARMKLVVNLVLGLNRAVLAEGLAFAASCGIDPRQALEVLRMSPASSTVMQTKGEKMIDRDFAPQARLRQHLKDVRLIRAAAEEQGAPTPLSDVHQQLLERLVAGGFGDEDNSAIIRVFLNHRDEL